MTRGLGNTLVTALQQKQIHTADLIEIGIVNNSTKAYTVYKYTNAPINITYVTDFNSRYVANTNYYIPNIGQPTFDTFFSVSTFLAYSTVEETSDLRRASINIELSAIDPTTLSEFINQGYLNSPVRIFRVVFDPATFAFSNDHVFEIYSGKISGFAVEEDETTSRLVFEVASVFADFEKTFTPRTNTDFLQKFGTTNGDLGFDYSDKIEKDIKWGR
jgi:hypothetical protein